MSDKYQAWKRGNLVVLDEHSRAKHEILRNYVEMYIQTLCKRHGMTEFKITLIDGFAGGGRYEGGEPGSPLVLLEAVEMAEAKINECREKKIIIKGNYYFIEEDKNTFNLLLKTLQESRYQNEIDKTIFIKNSRFNENVSHIVEDIRKRSPRSEGRALFFLDQTGYSAVHPKTIRDIRKTLPSAEFVITISTDWLIDFIGHDCVEENLKKLELDQYFDIKELVRLRKEKQVDWRYVIEAKLSVAWRQATGVSYFRPFFIEPNYNHRGYWLLHLSSHPKAHDVMTDIHWEKGNYFRHYGGGRGLDIFGYKPNFNLELPGISFNDTFRQQNEKALLEDLPPLIHEYRENGILFEKLVDKNRNIKAVSNRIVKEVLLELWKDKEIEILGPQGGQKRSDTSLNKNDIILPLIQRKLKF